MVSSLRDRAGLKLRQASQPAQAGRLSLAALRFCVFSILIVSSTGLMAADEPVEEKTESPRRSTFGLREFFKRGESPAASTPAAVSIEHFNYWQRLGRSNSVTKRKRHSKWPSGPSPFSTRLSTQLAFTGLTVKRVLISTSQR
jgi:hypothetical protein